MNKIVRMLDTKRAAAVSNPEKDRLDVPRSE